MTSRSAFRAVGRLLACSVLLALLLIACADDEPQKPTEPRCEVSPGAIDFGMVRTGNTSDISFTIRNSGGGTLAGVVSLSCPEFTLIAGGGGYSLLSGMMHQATVRFAPTSEGTKICSIALGTAGCSELSCTGMGRYPDPVCRIYPEVTQDFSSVPIGQTADRYITVFNDGGGLLSGTATIECPGFTIVSGAGPFTVSAGHSHGMTLRFEPTSVGSRTCLLDLGSSFCRQAECAAFGAPPAAMVLIPAGSFVMGSPVNEPGRTDDEAQHEVTISRAFYVSNYEVQQSDWVTLMGSNPSLAPEPVRPVETVTWYDALRYCNARSTREGLTRVYSIRGPDWYDNAWGYQVSWNRQADGYRLLTEAEWEYACRATSTTAFCSGGLSYTGCSPIDPNLDLVGWYCGSSGYMGTRGPGGRAPNAWGLYDMHGNVAEWCWDLYGGYHPDAVVDPAGPAYSIGDHVVRGGFKTSEAAQCRSASRRSADPLHFGGFVGLRVARNAP